MKMKLLLSYKLMNSNNVNSVQEMTKVSSDTSRETATALESSLHLFFSNQGEGFVHFLVYHSVRDIGVSCHALFLPAALQ